MARVLWIRLYKTIVWMSSMLERIHADTQLIICTSLIKEREVKCSHQVMASLEGICRPLWMAKTVKLQRRHSVLLPYSASCRSVDNFLPFKELTFSVGHDHVADTRSCAELLSQQFDVLREHLSAFLQAEVENFIRPPSTSGAQTGAAADVQTHLHFLWIGRFLLLQQFHQRFVLVHLSQTDSTTHSS